MKFAIVPLLIAASALSSCGDSDKGAEGERKTAAG
jgi:hypothetical protein